MHCLRPLMLLGALMSLAACARQQPLAVPTASTEPEPLLPELVRSARSIEKLWTQLASQQAAPQQDQPQARTLHAAHKPQTVLPRPHSGRLQGLDDEPDLQRRINLDWTGDLRTLLRRMASLIQYSFHEFGPRPALPIHISLHLENVTIAEALREAGLQAGRRAGVRVHGGTGRRMELVYAQ